MHRSSGGLHRGLGAGLGEARAATGFHGVYMTSNKSKPRYSAKISYCSGGAQRQQTIGIFDDKETAARAFDVRFDRAGHAVPQAVVCRRDFPPFMTDSHLCEACRLQGFLIAHEWRTDGPQVAARKLRGSKRWRALEHPLNFPTAAEKAARQQAAAEREELSRQKRTSVHVGVTWTKSKWVARICKHGKLTNLGCFAKEADAARAWDLSLSVQLCIYIARFSRSVV